MLNGALLTVPTAQDPRPASIAALQPHAWLPDPPNATSWPKAIRSFFRKKGETLQGFGNGLWPIWKCCMRNKRKIHSIKKMDALKSLPGHHSWCRLTQADVFWDKLEAWLLRGKGCQQAAHWGKVHTAHMTAHIYRFQCTWDTLSWGRRIRSLILQPGGGSKPAWIFFSLISGYYSCTYQKKKYFPNHGLPHAEEEDKVPTRMFLLLCIMQIKDTYSYLCKHLMTLVLLQPGNRDRKTVQGNTGGMLHHYVLLPPKKPQNN